MSKRADETQAVHCSLQLSGMARNCACTTCTHTYTGGGGERREPFLYNLLACFLYLESHFFPYGFYCHFDIYSYIHTNSLSSFRVGIPTPLLSQPICVSSECYITLIFSVVDIIHISLKLQCYCTVPCHWGRWNSLYRIPP